MVDPGDVLWVSPRDVLVGQSPRCTGRSITNMYWWVDPQMCWWVDHKDVLVGLLQTDTGFNVRDVKIGRAWRCTGGSIPKIYWWVDP